MTLKATLEAALIGQATKAEVIAACDEELNLPTPPGVRRGERYTMTKKWKLSDSGLQVYEGSKHIATVHYGGNPIVDVTEAIENATLIRQAPAMETELAALRAERDALRDALEAFVNNDAAGIVSLNAHAALIDNARAALAKYEAK